MELYGHSFDPDRPMTPSTFHTLIKACVGGEVTDDEAVRVEALLHQSSSRIGEEIRRVFHQIEQGKISKADVDAAVLKLNARAQGIW